MVKGFVLMTFVGGTGEHLDWFKKTREKLLKIEGVQEVFGVFGRWDMVARVETDSIEGLTSIVTDKIRSVPGIQSSETLIVIF